MSVAFAWFASGAVVIGAVASIFRPDNKLCPIDLPPSARAGICLFLGAVGVALQNLAGGVPLPEACSTAVAAMLAGWTWHGLAPAEKPGPKDVSGKGGDAE